MTDWIVEAWALLQRDLQDEFASHQMGCVRCGARGECNYARGLSDAYDKVEARLSPRREPLVWTALDPSNEPAK